MSEADLPALIGGRYRPLRLLGKGGMGIVYEVEHTHTGQHVALKVLTQHTGASAERFKREARAASSIQSDHIVRVTDADIAPELGGAPFFVMEMLEGGDLERIAGDRPASSVDVVGWLRQVARALDKAHAKGIVHRDLKPANLFLTKREDGSALVKVLDFGIAKVAAETTITHSDTLLGTPGFMAPEQADSSKGTPISFLADLYALGLIAFRLLTGRSYWTGGTLVQLLSQILVQPMPPPSQRAPNLGRAFDAWFLRACDRDPGKRFASAFEQVEALAVALGLPEQPNLSDSAPRTLVSSEHPNLGTAATLDALSTDLKEDQKRVARRRWLAAGLLGAVAALGIVTALKHGEQPDKGTPDRPLSEDSRLPSAHPSLGVAPSIAPPAASVPQTAETATTAVPPAASALPLASSKAARPAKQKSAPAPASPPDKGTGSTPSKTIWNER
jgi:serine/threonine protein kinase